MIRNLQAKVETAGNHLPVCIAADATIRSAASLMWEHDIGSLVVGDLGRPVGILSERDVVGQIAHAADPDVLTVRQVMTPYVVAARIGDPLSEAALKMLEEGIRHLPVLDEYGHVTGILSVRDLLRPLLLDALASPQ